MAELVFSEVFPTHLCDTLANRIPSVKFGAPFVNKPATLTLFFFLIVASLQVASAQTTINMSQDLVSLGIASENMTPNTPSLNSGPLLEAALEYTRSRPFVTKLIANKGAYYFTAFNKFLSDRHVYILNITNITIDFQGSDLRFFRANRTGLAFERCSNLVLENFSVDFDQLPFSQVTVTAVNTSTRTISYTVNPGYDSPTLFNTARSFYPGEEVHAFFFRGGRPLAVTSRFTVPRSITASAFALSGSLPWESAAVIERVRPGDIAVITPRGFGDGVQFMVGSNITIRNVSIYSSGSTGLLTNGVSNLLIERVYVIPKPGTDRLISTNADGISVQGIRENTTVRLSRAVRTLDDGFAAAALILGTVSSVTTPRRFVVSRQHNYFIPTGSTIVFQNRVSGDILGEAVVTVQMPESVGLNFGGSVTIDIDRDLPAAVGAGVAVYSKDPGARGSNLVLERNTVQDQVFARGISLWGLVNATVRGNYLRDTQMAAILGTHRLMSEDWMSPPIDNIDVQRNVIDGANTIFGTGILEKFAGILFLAQKQDFQPMLGSPHSNIRVTGNFIARPSRSAIRLQNVTTGSITGNVLVNPNNNPYVEGYWEDTFEPYLTEFKQPVVVKTSTGVSQSDNPVETTDSPITLTDSSYRRFVAYAPGSAVYLNSKGIGSLTTPAVSLRDANGTSHSVTVAATGTHFLEVTIPPTAALGGAYFTVTSGSVTRRGTLFVDSQDLWQMPLSTFGIAATYRLEPEVQIMPSTAGTGSFQITPEPPFAPWSVVSNQLWLTITSATSGSGPATVNYSVAANTGAFRIGTVSVGGATFNVNQQAPPPPCTFNLSGTAPPAAPATGQSGTLLFTASRPDCTWSASSDKPWAQVFPLNGTGNASISYTIFPNYTTSARSALFTVGGATATLSQLAAVGNNNRRFVGQMYFNFFGRTPSSAEVDFNESALNGGMARADFVMNFFNSAEFNAAGRFIAGLYVGILNRNAEYGGWLFIRNALATGTVQYTDLVFNFLDSAEFKLNNPSLTNRQFAALMYRQILLREGTVAELDFNEGALDGGLSRKQFATNFLQSAEFRLGTGSRLTTFLLYATLLLRDATPAEFAALQGALSAGSPVRTEIDRILAGPEFSALLN